MVWHRVIPTTYPDILVWHRFRHKIWRSVCHSDILPVYSDIQSVVYSDILSGISSVIYCAVFLAFYLTYFLTLILDTLPGISWHSFLHSTLAVDIRGREFRRIQHRHQISQFWELNCLRNQPRKNMLQNIPNDKQNCYSKCSNQHPTSFGFDPVPSHRRGTRHPRVLASLRSPYYTSWGPKGWLFDLEFNWTLPGVMTPLDDFGCWIIHHFCRTWLTCWITCCWKELFEVIKTFFKFEENNESVARNLVHQVIWGLVFWSPKNHHLRTNGPLKTHHLLGRYPFAGTPDTILGAAILATKWTNSWRGFGKKTVFERQDTQTSCHKGRRGYASHLVLVRKIAAGSQAKNPMDVF